MPLTLLTFLIPQNLNLMSLLFNLQQNVPRFENFPNCGRVGNPKKVECIWDCEWVDSPKYGQVPNPGPPYGAIVARAGLIYNLIKYPANISCLDDCTIIPRLQRVENNIPALYQLSYDAISQEPNIDATVIEICILYTELGLPNCSDILPRDAEIVKRLIGNSLTNSYIDPTLRYTLNQYPWTCSLRTAGSRGRHICGATLLSAPPSKTIIVGAAHCNYICKSSDGRVRDACCCRDPVDNFASCRTVSRDL